MCILHFKAKKKKKVLSNYNLPMFTTQNSLTNTPKKKKKNYCCPTQRNNYAIHPTYISSLS